MQVSKTGDVESLATMRMMTDVEVAEACRICRKQVWNMLRAGRLPEPVRLGGTRSVRWRAADIEAWIANGCRVEADGKAVAK